jgi:hypothetical protein
LPNRSLHSLPARRRSSMTATNCSAAGGLSNSLECGGLPFPSVIAFVHESLAPVVACRRFLLRSLLRKVTKQASAHKAQASLRSPYLILHPPESGFHYAVKTTG